MATAIRTIGHEDRLSLVEHLEELRTRLIVSGVVLGVVFGVCLWQNHALLHLINRPYEREKQGQVAKGEGPAARRCSRSRRCSKCPGRCRASSGSSLRPAPTCPRRFVRS